VYIGDGLATSGERGGDAFAERLRRSMTGSRARLFTVGVGAEVDDAMLGRLARVGGGEALRVEAPEQAVVRALQLSGALKTPTITDLEVELGEGLDDLFISTGGKLSRGQEMVVLARTHHDLPDSITVRGRLAGGSFEQKYPLVRDKGVLNQIVPRLWAHAFVERLLGDTRGVEAVRGKILSLGLEYGMMTPFTSFLSLDSESAFAAQGIQRRYRNFGGVKLTADAAWTRGIETRPVGVIAMLLRRRLGALRLRCLQRPRSSVAQRGSRPRQRAEPDQREHADRKRGGPVRAGHREIRRSAPGRAGARRGRGERERRR
jgi:hypothetical protein